MSEKNFVAYGDAESILTGYANRIKQSPTTFVGTQAQWDALSLSQKAEYTLVDITDDSLSPSGHVDWESNGKIGSKNLLPNKATTQTINGVTFTINSDGSVTANGTATSNAEIDIATNVPLNGNYILSDDFAGINGQYWAFANVDNGARQYILTSKEMPITISNKLDYFRVKVFSGVTANNITFKPMLRLATDSDSTYQPYAMTNKEITPYVQAISNPNLLDNPWFTVNQRGATSWSSGYGVDRWMPQRADITVNADKTLTVTPTELSTNNGYIGQRIEKENSLLGKTVTISALLSSGTIVSHTFDTIEDAVNNAVEGNYNFGYSTITSSSYDLVWFGLRSNSTISSVTIKAIKLELGSVSTLAMDTAPNYASELLKCQKYFVRLRSGFNESSITGFAVANSIARFGISLPTMMRKSPSVTVSDLSHWGASATNAQGALVATAISKQGGLGNIITLEITNSNITQSTTYILYSLNADSYIDFSADL